jgi:hypothetical protein
MVSRIFCHESCNVSTDMADTAVEILRQYKTQTLYQVFCFNLPVISAVVHYVVFGSLLFFLIEGPRSKATDVPQL